MIVVYDLEDNYITSFDSSKECAKYFNTTNKVIDTLICRSRRNPNMKKRDKKNKRWVKIVRMKEEIK